MEDGSPVCVKIKNPDKVLQRFMISQHRKANQNFASSRIILQIQDVHYCANSEFCGVTNIYSNVLQCFSGVLLDLVVKS